MLSSAALRSAVSSQCFSTLRRLFCGGLFSSSINLQAPDSCAYPLLIKSLAVVLWCLLRKHEQPRKYYSKVTVTLLALQELTPLALVALLLLLKVKSVALRCQCMSQYGFRPKVALWLPLCSEMIDTCTYIVCLTCALVAHLHFVSQACTDAAVA